MKTQLMKTRDQLIAEFTLKAEDQGLFIDTLMDGPLTAQVAIVGEGPGEQEARSGRPFSGGAGKLLWDTLRPHGFNRANCYVTNVVKRQISLSRKGNERHVVHRDELNRWIGLLRWELDQLPNLKTIIVLGNYAMEGVGAGDRASGISKWRGSVLRLNENKTAILTINPAYALRDLKMEPMFKMDIHKAASVIRGTFKPYEVETVINPTFKESMRFLKDLKRAKKPVSFDIEVVNMETACFGLTNDPHFGFCLSLRDHKTNRFTINEEADLLLALQDLGSTTPLVMQNGGFDIYWTYYKDHLRVPIWYDTLLAHHTLYPQLPHGLDFLTTQYTTHPYYKDEGKFWREGGDIDQFWRYNCTDVAITLAAQQETYKELKEQGLEKFFFTEVMSLIPHTTHSTVHGVRVDMKAKEEAIAQGEVEVDKLSAEFQRTVEELTDDPDYKPNPRSWQQLSDLFFNHLRLVGRGKSTDKANRERMLKNAKTPPMAREMLSVLNQFATAAKFQGTYAESRVDPDGRFRCDWKQYGVQKAPGRLSSSGVLWGTGANLQNQPPAARRMYVSDEGTVFFYFDMSQAEARVVAYRANIEVWKEQFERARLHRDYDCHRALAAEMWKVPYASVPIEDFTDEEKPQPTIRYKAKRCRHGLNYRMEAFKLAEVTGLPVYEAMKIFSLYHNITPELRQWWSQEERNYRRDRALYNAFGRRLKVIQRLDDEAMQPIIAFYPQSTIGDHVKRVWRQAHEDDRWDMRSMCIRLNVHDALIGIATPKTVKTALKICKEYAETPILIQDAWNNPAEPLIIPAECGISTLSVKDRKTGKVMTDSEHRWSNIEKVKI